MEKLNLFKQFKKEYSASTSPQIMDIGPARYLSICGQGDPSEKSYVEHLHALYSTTYTLKFMRKARGNDFVVPKLEGLWWYDETKYAGVTMDDAPQRIPRKEWFYRMLIRMPNFVTEEDLQIASNRVLEKKGFDLVKKLAFFDMHEGKVVQMLHLGPFDREPESLAQIAKFSTQHRLERNGLHHEIYLSDFNRTPSEKLKTILREPVR